MKMISAEPSKKTASGLVYSGACIFHGFLLGTDGVNDVTITLFNNTAGEGEEVVPTCEYDAALMGLNGVTGIDQYCSNGLYLTMSVDGGGAAEVVVQYSPSVRNPSPIYRD